MSAGTTHPLCRVCRTPLTRTFVDLRLSPLANSYVSAEHVDRGEMFYPLKALVCDGCWLVQLQEFETPANIFTDYAYFSSYSKSWLAHARAYAEASTARFGLGAHSKVVEIASNDGYLLRNFVDNGIPVLGIDPAANVAREAIRRGVPTEIAFFGRTTAQRLAPEHRADLMAANNVLAHVPDILDFVDGFRILLKPDGIATFEFPHLLQLVEHAQFDTIYHEHYSYLSLGVVRAVLRRSQLRVFDVEALPTHGGSLRVFACHEKADHADSDAVERVVDAERRAALFAPAGYEGFSRRVAAIKYDVVAFLIEAARQGKRVFGYGAAAKGNTFLNYCGIGPELLASVADASEHKQRTLLPGTRIPVVSPQELLEARPDYVLILPWNLKAEIADQLAAVRSWGGRFLTAIPALSIF